MLLNTVLKWFFCGLLCTLPVLSVDIRVDQQKGLDTEICFEDESQPCKTLDYVCTGIISNHNISTANIFIQGEYILYETLLLDQYSVNLTSIQFIGNSTTIRTNNSDIGIMIGHKSTYETETISYNITFSKLTFTAFGENTTSVILSWGAKYLVIQSCHFGKNRCAALNVVDTNISIEDSVFEDNSGSAVNKGEVYGKHSTFPYGGNSAGGAVAILFTKRETMGIATISKSIFRNNIAVSLSQKVIIDSAETSVIFSHTGGALLLAFMGQSSYAKVLIQQNLFMNNLASLGGGMTLTFHDTSGQNHVNLVENVFHQNRGSVCGGGFAIATWRQSNANQVIFKNTNFTYNAAQVGAGGRILLQSYASIYSKDPSWQNIQFQNTRFFRNKAASASALHINYNLGTARPFTPIIFDNVTFANHSTEVYKFSLQGPSAFSGVLLSNRVDLEFRGDSYFYYNEVESPTFLSNCEFYVKNKVVFYKNRVQTSGGALTMTDVSHLYLYPDSVLQFIENYAPVEGGALYVQTVGFPDMVYKYNPSCFIQYFVKEGDPIPPSQWKVTVDFIGNGAGLKGAAIFANTITPCVWDEEFPYYSFQKALHWKGFNFTANYISGRMKMNNSYSEFINQHVEIATDTINFKLTSDSRNQTVTAFPGQKIPFDIEATDELSNKVYSVPVASLQENKEMNLLQKYFIFNPNDAVDAKFALTYSLENEAYEQLVNEDKQIIRDITFVDSSSQFISNATIKVKVLRCKPGFYFKDDRCVCDNGPGSHVVRCEDDVVYIEKGYWGYHDSNDQLKVLQCPTNFCSCNQTDSTMLGCAFNTTSQCKPGRTGVLCGECKSGMGLDLMTYECVKCNGFSLALIVIIVVTIVTLGVVILILVINPKFSTLLRSILFFVQMLPYVLDGRLSFNKIVLTVTGWLDVGGVNSVPVKSCFIEQFNSMYAVALGYLYPALIFMVLIIVYVLHKCYLVHLKRSSPFQAFWILIVLMYKFLVETSLLLLFCVPINDSDGGRRIFYLDGSVRCFQGSHLTMTFIAAVVLLMAVFPPPILVALIVNGYLNFGPSIVDALTQGLGRHVRWWWSIDFLRRIAFIAIYVFATDTQLKQTLLTICCVIALSFHIQQQPYRNKLANHGETFLLLCLTIIVVIEPLGNEVDSISQSQSMVSAIIISMAAGYCVLITLYVWIAYFIKRFRTRGYTQIDDLDKDSGDEGNYRENLRRRISGGKRRYDPLTWLSSPTEKLKKSQSDRIVGGRCPSPFHTRSYLHDKI
eukprot:TCONS_00004031-protein